MPIRLCLNWLFHFASFLDQANYCGKREQSQVYLNYAE